MKNHINNGFSNEENKSILYGSNGRRIVAKTSNQKKIIELHNNNDLLFVIGPAGTGKTYISVALGVKALKEKKVKKIIITRPVVEAGENLGFLPGDLQDKIDPYLKPIYDALEDMIPLSKMKKYIENKTIEIAPLAYMRGRTLKNSFILLDEAQNISPLQIKTLLTRIHDSSKLVIQGDLSQCDKYGENYTKSGFYDIWQRLKTIEGVGYMKFSKEDCVRSGIVAKILQTFNYNGDSIELP